MSPFSAKTVRATQHLFIGITAILLCLFLVPQQGSAAQLSYNVLYYNPDLTSEDTPTMISTMKTYIDYLAKQVGADMKAFYFASKTEMDAWLKTNKAHLGIFSPLFIVENHTTLKFAPISIISVDGDTFYEKVIISRKDSPYKTVDDLKAKKLAMSYCERDNYRFLNSVIFSGKIDVQSHFQTVKTVPNLNSAVLAVLNKGVDAALINLNGFLTVQDFNPKVEQEIHVIFTSGKIPFPGLVAYTENVSPDFIAKVTKEVTTMHQNPEGAQALQTFSIEAWKPATLKNWSDFAAMAKLPVE